MEPIIEINGLSKRYALGAARQSYVALRDVLTYIASRPFQFLKKKAETSLGMHKNPQFWALRDISFTVQPGEVIGIIGKNGAGKSTLLKILTGITPPTSGEALLRGRVSSLLEVGTGFHPELTGRENIYLNGAILGMGRKEIAKKFDEIVDFAGISQFLDTPVKHYSSGMYVRLAFSVAAHMEPDILIVDEVLAVGDAEFQKKCLGKMSEVTRSKGRTILFVSHNMQAIQELCHRTVLLEKGTVKMIGPTEQVITHYLSSVAENAASSYSYPAKPEKRMQVREIVVRSGDTPSTYVEMGSPFSLDITYDVNDDIPGAYVGAILFDQNNAHVALSADTENEPDLLRKRERGTYRTTFTFPALPSLHLNHGVYTIRINLEITNFAYDQVEIPLQVISRTTDPDFSKNKPRGTMSIDGAWNTQKLPNA